MAVKSPLFAVMAAHIRASWNRARRESELNGAWAVILVVGLLGLIVLLPLLGAGVLTGYVLGTGMLRSPFPSLILGALLTLGPVGVGLVDGVLGGGRNISLEAFRLYPLRFRTLVVAELVAGAGSLGFLVLAAVGFCFFVGLSVGRPALAPWALIWWLSGGLVHLLVVQLATGVGSALVRHLRFGLFVLIILVAVGPSIGMAMGGKGHTRSAVRASEQAMKQSILAAVRKAGHVAAYLPGTQSVRGALDLARGEGAVGALRQLIPLGCMAVLALFGVRLMALEERATARRESVRTKSKTPERLWTFPTPIQGLARLQLTCVFKSHLGKFQFLMPIFPLVFFGGPLRTLAHGTMALPFAVAYVLLTTGGVSYNQFGLDRHGIKALFLLPLRGQDLLAGKAFGVAVHGILLMGLTLGVCAPFTHSSVVHIFGALLVGACAMAINMVAGQWASVWQPRALPWDSFNKTNLPFATAMVNLGVNSVAMGFVMGVYLFTTWLAPLALLPVMALLTAGLWVLYAKVALPLLGQYLDRHRERVMEALES